MKQRRRIYYSQTQKDEMWDRWQRGESMHDIAKAFDRGHSSVQRIISETGGFRPSPRKRSTKALTLSERESISRGIASQLSMRQIADQLDRSPSTICREIHRNGGYAAYRATAADQAAWDRALRPKSCKLVCNQALARAVAQKLKKHWSPDQIAGWLKRQYPDDEHYHVSHETLYKSLFIQARGVLKKGTFSVLENSAAESSP